MRVPLSKNIEDIVELIAKSGGAAPWISQEGDANLGAEFTRAILARDFSRISELLSKTFSFLVTEAIAEINEADMMRSIVASDWVDAIPANITIRADQLLLSSPKWRAVRPVMLGELFLRVVDEIAKIDLTLEDTRRDALIALLNSNGFTIGKEIVERYNLLLASIQSELESVVRTKIEGSPQILNGPKKELSIIELADSFAVRGEYQQAIDELMRNPSAVAYLPGVAMRFAEWNMALGRADEAARSALKELATRPDNRRAFDIAFHDKDALVRVIETSPPAVIQMFQELVKSYAQQGGL